MTCQTLTQNIITGRKLTQNVITGHELIQNVITRRERLNRTESAVFVSSVFCFASKESYIARMVQIEKSTIM